MVNQERHRGIFLTVDIMACKKSNYGSCRQCRGDIPVMPFDVRSLCYQLPSGNRLDFVLTFVRPSNNDMPVMKMCSLHC